MVSLRDYYQIGSVDYGGDINSSFSIGNSDYEIYMEITRRKIWKLFHQQKTTKFKD
jgi:hypothetical protein